MDKKWRDDGFTSSPRKSDTNAQGFTTQGKVEADTGGTM
jgi:hypothetical protein